MKKKLPSVVRTLIGIIFLVFGLNGFFHFLPMPPMPEGAGALIGAFIQTGYFMTLVFVTEVLVGVMFLTNSWAKLALVILAPLLLHILCFHLFLAPEGLVLPLIILVGGVYLAYCWRDAYKPLLNRK
jgi:putative oxidoreductase